MATTTVTVSGMMCGGCEQNVEETVGALASVSEVTADHEADTVEVVHDGLADGDLQSAIEEAGYELAG